MNSIIHTMRAVLIEEKTEINSIEQIGYSEAIRVVGEFLNIYSYPLITGEARKQWVADRLEKVWQRYFEPI